MQVELIRRRILIGDANDWFENFIIMGITHETIHLVIHDLEGLNATDRFDNIFGYANPSILLLPENDSEFYSIQQKRLEKEFWNEKGKRRDRCLDTSKHQW